MLIEHKHLDNLYRAYSTNYMDVNDELNIFFASEEKNYPCYAYRGKDFKTREIVWEKGGGCMSIIPLKKRKNQFLAIMDFYLKESPSSSKLVWGRYDDEDGWIIQDLFFLPYLHRFDVYVIDNQEYLVCATIADSKEYKEDWRVGGSIYASKLPINLNDEIKLTKLKSNLFRNHGYMSKIEDGKVVGYFSSDEGLHRLVCDGEIENWKFEHVFDKMLGEVAFCDINGDGVDEMLTIEAFHGNKIKVYEYKDAGYVEVFEYKNKIDFAHTIHGVELAGEKYFLAGVRREDAEMFLVGYKDGEYYSKVIDKNCGPANLTVVNLEDRDIICSSNHTRNEVAIYNVYKEK